MHNRLKQLRLALGLTQPEVATKVGMTQTAISKLELGQRRLKDHQLERFAEAFGWQYHDIYPTSGISVRAIGLVATGGAVHVLPISEQREVAMPPEAKPTTVAVKVEGDALIGRAEDGDIVYFDHTRDPPHPDLIGKLVAAETSDGEIFIRILRPGTRHGLWTLARPIGPPIEDISLRWAVPVTWIRPAVSHRRSIPAPK